MHPLVLLAVESLIGVVLALTLTVVVLARLHKARMKKVDAHYSPFTECELHNRYAQSGSAQSSSAQSAALRAAANRENASDRGEYALLPKVAGR